MSNSNYTLGIVKQMINAGITAKPADCPQDLWDQAQIKDVSFETVEQTQAQAPVETTNVPATLEPVSTNYPTSYGLDAFGATAAPITVDAMLKNKSGSMMINGKEILKMPFKAKLLLAESKIKHSIKCNVNGQLQYFSTYGGGRCTNGMDWNTVVNECTARDKSAYEYESMDMCFELAEDLKGTDGSIVANKGQRIGYTTAATNRAEIVKFKNTCLERGLNLANAEVDVKVSFNINTNKANQNWTTIGLEVL